MPSRATTSASCGPEKPVLSSRASAPRRAQAVSASTKPRWLRTSSATVSGGPPGSSRSATARASARSSSARQVSEPRSSMIAVASGIRAAESDTPASAFMPVRRSAVPMRT